MSWMKKVSVNYLDQLQDLEEKHRKSNNEIAKREIMRQIKELEVKIILK
jgi:hypothetical protein